MKRLSAFAGSLLACTVLLFGVAQAEIKDRTLRFAFVNNVGHPQEQGAKKFADLVAERSGGKIKVTLFPGGQLGGDLQVVSALQGGKVVDLTVLNAGLLAGINKEFGLYDLPFVFDSGKVADAVVDGPVGTTNDGQAASQLFGHHLAAEPLGEAALAHDHGQYSDAVPDGRRR
jgi:TRAP-type C4-dicarboxylate transport system substrate-binding protein